MSGVRLLVAGIGNIFLGDDGFGVEVARRMAGRPQPEGVLVVDFGIRGFDLAYALMDGYDAVILADATSQGGEPGTIYTIELDAAGDADREPRAMQIETHGMNPMRVLEMVRSMGGQPGRILLVGCEPETLGGEEGALGLSATAERAVDIAIGVIERLVGQLIQGERDEAISHAKG